jgi:hypothetical protein
MATAEVSAGGEVGKSQKAVNHGAEDKGTTTD